MKHSAQWYAALGRSLGHSGFVTLAEVEQAEAEAAADLEDIVPWNEYTAPWRDA